MIIAACSSDDGNNTNLFAGIPTTTNTLPVVTADDSTTATGTITRGSGENANNIILTLGTGNPTTYSFTTTRGEAAVGNDIVDPAGTNAREQIRIQTTQSAGNFHTSHARITTIISGTGLDTASPTANRISMALTGDQTTYTEYTAATQQVEYNGQWYIVTIDESDNQQGQFTLNVDFTSGATSVAGVAMQGSDQVGEFSGGTVGNLGVINNLQFVGHNGTAAGEGRLGALEITDIQAQIYGAQAAEVAGIGATTATGGLGATNAGDAGEPAILGFIGRR